MGVEGLRMMVQGQECRLRAYYVVGFRHGGSKFRNAGLYRLRNEGVGFRNVWVRA